MLTEVNEFHFFEIHPRWLNDQSQLSKKNVMVIYMNLRGEEDTLGFPLRDPIPSKILTSEFPATTEEYRITCHAFFIALFDTLDEHLYTPHATRKIKERVMSWVRQMCDMSYPPRSSIRFDFFQQVHQKYTKVITAGFAAY